MPPLTLKHIDRFTPQDFAVTRVWAGCYDREDDLWEMAEDGYSEAEIAAAIEPFNGAWPDEDHYFPINETGIDRQPRTRGLVLASAVHTARGQVFPGLVSQYADVENATVFFRGRRWSLDVSSPRGDAEFRNFMQAIGEFALSPLIVETGVTGRRWTIGLR